MISDKMADALNQQLNEEMFSSYLYLSMSAYLESINLMGMAQWMKIQSGEEYAHAIKFYDYLNQTGAKVKLKAIKEPKTDWNSPQEVFNETLLHENFITDCINKLSKLAEEESDFATRNFLNWFVDEQVEEVSTVIEIVERFKLIGDDKPGLFWLDRELGERQTNAQ